MTCPLRRFASRLHRDTCASPRRCQPLMELTALQSVVSTAVEALVGYASPTDASPFLTDRGGLPSDTGPRLVEENGFILSCPWLSSRVRRACVGPFDRAPSLGSRTSSRHQPSESTTDGHPRPAYVPPATFHTFSTACSSPDLAGLFHPAATSRLPAPGVSSPDLTGTTSSVARALSPLAMSPAAGYPTTPESVASTSRPCSRPGSAASTEVLAPCDARVPSCVWAPSGSLHQS
jgi:hypothetical protein